MKMTRHPTELPDGSDAFCEQVSIRASDEGEIAVQFDRDSMAIHVHASTDESRGQSRDM